MRYSRSQVFGATLLGSAAAIAAVQSAAAQTTQSTGSGNDPTVLQEIIVTATKRPEPARKISGSITALSGTHLEELGAQDMSDYLTRTPGVVFNAAFPGNSSVAIRGVSTTTSLDQGQGTTGFFINEVPLTDPYGSVAIPDIDTFDVENVSVLRGPQGTLFGSASLGGAINYQAAKPDLTQYQLHLQGTFASTQSGAPGGSGKIMFNLPLVADTFAVRGVYVYRDEGGYIDNIGTGQKDANRTLIRSGRVEALWTPTSTTKINYLFLQQTEDTRDLGYAEPDFAGPLEKNTPTPEAANFKTLIHNLRLDQDLGFGTLTATASYHEKNQYSPTDITLQAEAFLPGVTPAYTLQTGKSDGTTFEVRLASAAGRRFEYLVGAMHDTTHEYFVDLAHGTGSEQVIEALYSPLFGAGIGQLSAPGDVFFHAVIPVEGQETAVFGEAAFHFNEQWKLSLGGRAFDTKVTNSTTETGFLNLVSTGELATQGSGSQTQRGFTPKGSVTWTPGEDFMGYVLVDKGFRFGGPNLVTSEQPGLTVPGHFSSDSLINYELGARSDWLGHRLQLDSSVFYIDWSNIQLHLQTPLGLNYAANAGKAKIYGAEATGSWLIAQGLTWQTNLTYLDAALSSPFNPGGGQPVVPDGSTLPGASKWQISNSLVYNLYSVPLQPGLVLAHRFISRAPGIFLTGNPQGDYHLFDARASMHIKNVGVTAFVDNIGNSHGVTTANTLPPLQEYLVRPRTFGITLDYQL